MNWQYILVGVGFAYINFAILYFSYLLARHFVLAWRMNARQAAKIPNKIFFALQFLLAAAVVGRLLSRGHAENFMIYFLISATGGLAGAWKRLQFQGALTGTEGKSRDTAPKRPKKKNAPEVRALTNHQVHDPRRPG